MAYDLVGSSLKRKFARMIKSLYSIFITITCLIKSMHVVLFLNLELKVLLTMNITIITIYDKEIHVWIIDSVFRQPWPYIRIMYNNNGA